MRQFELATRAAGIGYWCVEADGRSRAGASRPSHCMGCSPRPRRCRCGSGCSSSCTRTTANGCSSVTSRGCAAAGHADAGDAHRAHRRQPRHVLSYSRLEGRPDQLRFLRRADRRHRTSRRRGRAAPGQRARRAGHTRRRHRHLGAGPARPARPSGTSRCSACAACSRGPQARRSTSASRWSTPTTARSTVRRLHDATAEGRLSSLRVPRPLARRQRALARLALAAVRDAKGGRAAHRRQLGRHRQRATPSSRASRPRWPSARARPSRSSSRA